MAFKHHAAFSLQFKELVIGQRLQSVLRRFGSDLEAVAIATNFQIAVWDGHILIPNAYETADAEDHLIHRAIRFQNNVLDAPDVLVGVVVDFCSDDLARAQFILCLHVVRRESRRCCERRCSK